jgi:hypothetical protein
MKKLRKVLRRRRGEAHTAQEGVPRITNETVAAHREEVLGKARKYIYPLQHSKHRIVLISTSLFIATTVAFFTYCTLALYKFQSSSTFLYRVTQVIPFPIARTGGSFIAYENYLFELRHYQHYYETQIKADFDNKDKEQLEQFKRKALEKVVDDAYVKQLARTHNVTVTDREVDDQIAIARSQKRLGDSDRVFEDVIKDYWGWTIGDFKRSLRQQLLAQKVAATLDKDARARAESVLAELKAGGDFAALAKQYSENPQTKENGGEYGFPIDQTSRDIPAQATDALFKLKPGEFTEIINTGYSLEILKHIESNGQKIRAAHIVFNFKDIDTHINDLKDKQKTKRYIRLPEAPKSEEEPPTTTDQIQ